MYLEDSIRQIVKDIDPRFDCHFEHNRAGVGYAITQRTPLGNVLPYAFVPWDGVTKEFFDNMRKSIYTNRNGDPLREVAESEEKHEKRLAERQDEEIDYLVKSTAPRLKRAIGDI